MSIDFKASRWDDITNTFSKLWNRELGRPVIGASLHGRDPKRDKPNTPLLTQATCADLSISAQDLIDRVDYELSCYEFIGDAYPILNLASFGPGLAAAFLGAKLDNSTGRVWFHPTANLDIKDIHLTYDSNNIWLNRIKDIYRAGAKRWQGQVVISMPDLGGNLDIVSTFRPSDQLLFDLYDYPKEVKRVLKEAHDMWHIFYNELFEINDVYNYGHTDWSGVLSTKKSYILQCDFAYMIGPDMFNEFVNPELVETTKKLTNTIYHLDGSGQVAHLDTLLENNLLDGIQWVPGDGAAPQHEYLEIYEKVSKANKLSYLFCGIEGMEIIMKHLGDYNDIFHSTLSTQISDKETCLKTLGKFGVV